MAVNTRHINMVGETSTGSQGFSISTQQMMVAIGLGLIVLLGAFLRLYQLGEYSIGNAYYAATVQSMLTSWHNFFFASFEPGGSVTVDKPPLGFWIQAVSAYFLGVNGFALALPQALAGVLSIPLLYVMVKGQFGRWAGLIAALALAITPVTISTERNNTIDGMLLFFLLLAIWAFLRSVRLGRFRYLLLGAFLIGLGFNIKMLQAFMPLPGLYAFYLLGAPHSWIKRITYLTIATILLVVVSLSWAVVVDLTPAESRPYIGSSTDNSVLELIAGHNGIKRLGLSSGPGAGGPNGPRPNDGGPGGSRPINDGSGGGPPSASGSNQGGQFQPSPPGSGQAGQFGPQSSPGVTGGSQGGLSAPRFDGNQAGQFPPPPPGNGQAGQFPPPPPGDGQAGQFGPPSGGDGGPQGGPPGGGPGGPGNEVGQAGLLRLFRQPLVTQASWLLPLALLGLPLILLMLGWTWPLSQQHLALVLWGGWLLPEVAYFSFNTGLFHAYYLIMLGPPLAALVGATGWAIWQVFQQRHWLGWAVLALLAGVTIVFQLFTLGNYAFLAVSTGVAAAILLVAGLGLLALSAWQRRQGWGKVAMGAVLVAMMVAPLVWSGLTTFNSNPDVNLPHSGPSIGQPPRPRNSGELSTSQQAILNHLQANTDADGYLVAAASSHQASPYILATQRPVLTFGGFNGGDDVIGVDQLAQMVTADELRFVLGPVNDKPEIQSWLTDNCTVVNIPGVSPQPEGPGQNNRPPGPHPGGQEANTLYDCGGR